MSVGWTIINAVCLLAPVFLVWGWAQYVRTPNRSTWCLHASAVGLAAPILSVVLGIVDRTLAHPTIGLNSFTPAPRISRLVVWIPILGLLVGLMGRPRLILPIVWASLATVLFWYGVTLP